MSNELTVKAYIIDIMGNNTTPDEKADEIIEIMESASTHRECNMKTDGLGDFLMGDL